MTSRHLITVVALLWFSMACSGAEPDRKQRPSTFEASKIARDPFIRIDASNLANQSEVVFSSDENIAESLSKLFRVTGISKYSVGIALINGKAFAEKDTFTVKSRDKEFRVTLLKVNAEGVELEYGGKIVSVPIARAALSSDRDGL